MYKYILKFVNLFKKPKFHNEIKNETPVDPLLKYGLKYHWTCELHDQKKCLIRDSRGIAIPYGTEHGVVLRHCMAIRKQIALELIEDGLATPETAKDQMRKAIQIAHNQFHKEWDEKNEYNNTIRKYRQ